MTIQDTMNAALVARGLLPMDGHCTCAACGLTGLDRDQMHDRNYCKVCVEDAGRYASYEHDYVKGDDLVYDYVRGRMVAK